MVVVVMVLEPHACARYLELAARRALLNSKSSRARSDQLRKRRAPVKPDPVLASSIANHADFRSDLADGIWEAHLVDMLGLDLIS
jgi:hypothetical protein